MELPKVTKQKPYIKFEISESGDLKLGTSEQWWGGMKQGFLSTSGSIGNTCKPRYFHSYLKYLLNRKIKDIEKEISTLKKSLEKAKCLKEKVLENYENIKD